MSIIIQHFFIKLSVIPVKKEPLFSGGSLVYYLNVKRKIISQGDHSETGLQSSPSPNRKLPYNIITEENTQCQHNRTLTLKFRSSAQPAKYLAVNNAQINITYRQTKEHM